MPTVKQILASWLGQGMASAQKIVFLSHFIDRDNRQRTVSYDQKFSLHILKQLDPQDHLD